MAPGDKRLCTHFLPALFVLTICAGLAARQRPSGSKDTAPLLRFYAVTQVPSDATHVWVDRILDVRVAGDGVRVRFIHIAPVDSKCPHAVAVKAAERVIPKTTVASVAGKFKLCSYPEDDFAGVIEVAKRKEEEIDVARPISRTIVARCGEEERLFELPDKDTVKFDALKLADPRISALWDMAGDVETRVFGKDFSWSGTPEQEKRLQELGAKVVPDILAGMFSSGFPDTTCDFAECADHNAKSALQGYAGVIAEANSCPSK
jgi:hypothetical protein